MLISTVYKRRVSRCFSLFLGICLRLLLPALGRPILSIQFWLTRAMLCVAYKLLIFCCVQMCPIMLKMRICWMGDTYIGSLHRFVNSRNAQRCRARHVVYRAESDSTAAQSISVVHWLRANATLKRREISRAAKQSAIAAGEAHIHAIPLSPATRISIWSYVKINLPWSLYNFRFCSPQTSRSDLYICLQPKVKHTCCVIYANCS